MHKNIDKILSEFVKKSNEFIPANEIILFGSYARGTQNENSDIDVAVIVNEFSGNYLEASANLFSFVSQIDYRIEPVLLVRTHDKPGFIEHVKANGKLLYSQN